jgi:L-2-hydroxyglutarate oxidase LhgO
VEQADVVVIGAGVVGLAIARHLSLAGREVLVLESAEAIGTGVSSRNSEVLHAGLYYNQNSLKARFCVSGKHLLRAYCRERAIGLNQCGKLVVAEKLEQLPELARIKEQGERNGVDDLRILTAAEAHALEPELRCVGALFSPSSGIIDSHQYMLALQGDAEAKNCTVVFHAPVASGRIAGDRIILAAGDIEIESRLAINSAGLSAQPVAAAITGFDRKFIPPLHYAKGNYFSLSGKSPFSRLVYPMPEPGGLGIHFTLDLAGSGRFGPDVEWIDSPDYDVDGARAAVFADRIKRYWPGLNPDMLHAAYAGIRPKVERPGGSSTDFIIQGPAQHGCPGIINLFGIESPGLTASLAIAGYVGEMAASVK